MTGAYFGNVQDAAIAAVAEESATYTKNISTSASLEAIIGAALPAKVCGVELVSHSTNTNDIHWNPGGAATSANGFIEPGTGRVFLGDKTTLDKIRLYAAGASSASIVVYIERR